LREIQRRVMKAEGTAKAKPRDRSHIQAGQEASVTRQKNEVEADESGQVGRSDGVGPW
jgi:hypothetical protein